MNQGQGLLYRKRTSGDREYGAAGASQFIEVKPEFVESFRNSGVELYTRKQVNEIEGLPENFIPGPPPFSPSSAPRGTPIKPFSFATVQPKGGRRKTRRAMKKRKTMKRKHYKK
jgi:hypothetical protein